MKTYLIRISVSLCLACAGAFPSGAQDYTAPQVAVSKEKVRSSGKVYYSHVVQEKQTLYSICKAYQVTLQEIYDANPALHLETEGLKKNQILLIPAKEVSVKDLPLREEEAAAPEKRQEPQSDDYFFHRVKWFEDLGSIARKYGVSSQAIMNINGMTSSKVKRRQMLKIPRHPELWESLEEDRSGTENAKADTAGRRNLSDFIEDIFSGEGSHEVQASMLLPFHAKGKTNDLIMDFYSGALLAARDLGNDGTTVDLSVFDVGTGPLPVTKERFSRSDFTIGPVSNSDIGRAVNICGGSSWIVSPLDPKVEALADTIPNIIHAPTTTKAQIGDMVGWIRSDLKPQDRVILITQKGVQATDYASAVQEAVADAALPHTTAAFSILDGRSIMGNIAGLLTTQGTNRILTASDSEAFIIEVVRNLYLLAHRHYDIVLYSTAKIRTFDTIDIEQLHNINLHVSVSYFVDYDAKEVQNFLLDYRALFNAEPSQFSFQGYDLMMCFSTLRAKYGKRWSTVLDREKVTGLQSDFGFSRTGRGGYVNKAVRRIVYAPDYSISMVR